MSVEALEKEAEMVRRRQTERKDWRDLAVHHAQQLKKKSPIFYETYQPGKGCRRSIQGWTALGTSRSPICCT